MGSFLSKYQCGFIVFYLCLNGHMQKEGNVDTFELLPTDSSIVCLPLSVASSCETEDLAF